MKNNLILLKRFFSFICSILIFISVFSGTGLTASAAMVTRGETINYSSYIPGGTWQTHRYYVDGNLAYCIQSELAQVNDGDYGTIIETFDTYPLLCKVLFYGYGGPAYKMGEFFSGYGITLTEEQAYLYTHIAANYAYGGNVWYGLDESTAASLHLTDWIIYCSNNVCLPENKSLTGGIVKITTPAGAQRVAYLDSFVFSTIPMGIELKINFDKTKNTYGDATTHNAVYGIFDSTDAELQRITLTIPAGSETASADITCKFDNSGTYYIKEISAPEGYILDTNKYLFTVNVSAQSISFSNSHFMFVNSKEITFTESNETPVKGRFSFIKKESSGNPLSGAGFDVYLKSALSKSGGKWDFSSASPVCSRLTSDASGVVSSPELDYGTYVIHEAVVPEGKLAVDDFEVKILAAGTVSLGDKTDNTIQGKFSLKKTGEDGFPVKDAGFSVYRKSSLSINSDGTYNFSSATPVGGVLTTDANGMVTSGLLDYGTYVVCESVVPSGYRACNPFEVKIENHNVTVDVGNITDTVVPAKFRIIKKDSESDEIILKGGAKFKIFDVKNDVYVSIGGEDTFTTDDTGTVTTSSPIPLGTYRIEEIEAPEGYLLDSSAVEIVFDSTWPFTMEGTDKIITAELKNTPKRGSVEITKTGKGLTGFVNNKFVWTDVNLPGAVYEIHADEDIYSPDNRGNLIHAKDDLVGTLTTDSSGHAAMDNLYLGKYYLVEVTAPAGYVIDTTHKNFELSYNDSSATPITSLNFFYDEKQNIVLNLSKTDAETKKPLAGAEFGIYADEDIYAFDGTILVSAGELIATALSDANGKIDFGLDLPYAKYKVREINAPINYVLNPTEYSFAAVYPASNVGEVSFTYSWENAPVRGSLEITKTGETLVDFRDGKFIWENKPLKGAAFNVIAKEDIYTYDNALDANGNRTLYYAKDQIVENIETGENGTAKTSNLPVGNYCLVETAAPYGMIINTTPIDFSIDYKDQNTALVLTQKNILNERQKITLKVTKAETGSEKNLSGGKFNLYADEDIKNYKGDVIAPKGTLISDTEAVNGKIDFALDLPHAVYKITEEKAPADYFENDEEYEIDLSYTDSTVNNLTADLNIFDTRLPHFAKVMMKVKPAFKSKSKSNYITEDYGEDGYSVLLISDGPALPVSSTSNMWFCIFASSILLLAGSFLTLFVLIKKRKEKA